MTKLFHLRSCQRFSSAAERTSYSSSTCCTARSIGAICPSSKPLLSYSMGNMEQISTPEVWLRGPLPDIPPLLQPVAHALLQAREEVEALMSDFEEELLWTRPGGVASAGFHLRHLAGVLDRLFTYARGEQLSAAQQRGRESEGQANAALDSAELVTAFHVQR